MAKDQIEFYQYIAPDGRSYNLHDFESRALLSIEGTGMPEIEYITQRGPFQHGETYLDYRLQPRIIQAVFRSNASDRAGHWRQRNDLIDILRPNRQFQNKLLSGRLRIVYLDENQDYTYRDINCFIDRGPTFSAHGDTWDEWGITETLRFVCPDPTFYNPGQVCYTWPLANITNRIVFSETWPLVFGDGIVNENITVTYTGTWKSYPAIVINGPINGPIITNTSTGKKIQLHYSISTGEKVSISLSYGRKTIISDTGSNLIGTISDDSNFTEFCIEPHPTVTDGQNIINLIGTEVNANTTVSLAYYTRYIGI